MALSLTARQYAALKSVSKEPNLALKIDGLDDVIGAMPFTRPVRFGDPGLVYGTPPAEGTFFWGGITEVEGGERDLIEPNGSSQSIRQTLDIDQGKASSISNLSVALIDDGFATQLISPGVLLDDILQRKCIIYYGFNGTTFPDDYSIVFRGRITDVTTDSGKVILQISSPDDQKRTNIFKKAESKLVNQIIDDTQTAIVLDTYANLLKRMLGPDGNYDSAFESFIRIDDEIIKFTDFVEVQSRNATVTIASPSVWTLTSHGFPEGLPVVPSTDGSLPTGFVSGQTYYVVDPTTHTFKLSATPGGAAIDGTGSQSGTHSIANPQYLSGVTRGALNSIAVAHDAEADVSAYYRLTGNGVILALKMMASGFVDPIDGSPLPSLDEIPVTSFNSGDAEYQANALFFHGVNVAELYGLTIGDWVYATTGASEGANNISQKQITDIIRGATGDFVVLDGVSFVDEIATPAVVSFQSQYATLPDGCALGPDEIDVDEHLRLYDQFLSSINYDFYIKEGIDNAREFIEQQIYLPMAAYTLPRKARASVGYHIQPIPGTSIKTFNASNIKRPDQIKVKRSMNKNFFNEIIYKFDEDAVEDKFKSGYIAISENSKSRIKGSPNKTLIIEAKGLRSTDQGQQIAQSQSLRRLERYQYGAESFSFQVLLQDGFEVEIGDIIILDGTDLKISDTRNASRNFSPRLLEIQDKQFSFKTGDIQLEGVDTNFEGASRYGLISPSSIIQTGLSTTQFTIRPSYSMKFGANEFRKWQSLVNPAVIIRNADFSIVYNTILRSASSNTITVDALPVIPSPDMVMELAHYDHPDQTDQVKLIYAFMRDSAFADGGEQYLML